MNRAEHLEWAKARVIAHCDAGDWQQAFASLVSDLNKHPDTRNHSGLALAMKRIAHGDLTDPEALRAFIGGFN